MLFFGISLLHQIKKAMGTTAFILYLEGLTIEALYAELGNSVAIDIRLVKKLFTKRELIDRILEKQSRYTQKYTDVGFNF